MVLRIVKEYERLAKFKFGKYLGMMGPGIVIVIPIIHQAKKVDLREEPFDVPPQQNITKDNANVDVDFVVYMRVMEPVAERVVLEVTDYRFAVRQLATTTLRAVIGDLSLDDVLSRREYINSILQTKLDEVTDRWGVKVTAVEIREILPPPRIQEAMTRQMSAERTRRAQITESEGIRDAAINVAQGDKRAAILEAEGQREARILAAQGRREAQILEAEGFALALQKINAEAQGAAANTMGLQYLDMMRSLGESASTKWVIPMELANVARSMADRLGGLGVGTDSGAGLDGGAGSDGGSASG